MLLHWVACAAALGCLNCHTVDKQGGEVNCREEQESDEETEEEEIEDEVTQVLVHREVEQQDGDVEGDERDVREDRQDYNSREEEWYEEEDQNRHLREDCEEDLQFINGGGGVGQFEEEDPGGGRRGRQKRRGTNVDYSCFF